MFIKADGVKVVRDFRIYSVRLVKSHEFKVGEHEKHAIRIDKHRPLALAGIRSHPVKAHVDGNLLTEGVA